MPVLEGKAYICVVWCPSVVLALTFHAVASQALPSIKPCFFLCVACIRTHTFNRDS